MNNCILDEYMKFLEKNIYTYYRVVLGGKYNKDIVATFINKYIDVRYKNITVYTRGYSFADRINKELRNISKEIVKQDTTKEDYVRKIFILTGYLLYFDNCFEYLGNGNIFKALYSDENLVGFIDLGSEEVLKEQYNNFKKKKKEFFDLFIDKKFSIIRKRVTTNLYIADLEQNCNISQLYSEYAIDRAFNTGTTRENKIYLLLVMLSAYILDETINLTFASKYIVDLPDSLFGKSKKVNRYLKAIDNDVIKDRISFRITYDMYTKHKEEVNDMINAGFSFSVILDETYDENLQVLDLFMCTFVYEKYEYYDIIIGNKDNINTRIISK